MYQNTYRKINIVKYTLRKTHINITVYKKNYTIKNNWYLTIFIWLQYDSDTGQNNSLYLSDVLLFKKSIVDIHTESNQYTDYFGIQCLFVSFNYVFNYLYLLTIGTSIWLKSIRSFHK